MRRATEKGLLVSFIGFFGQIIFQLLSLRDLSYICFLTLTELMILVGIIFLYMGRFEFPGPHVKVAKYAIILFIFVHVIVFVIGLESIRGSLTPAAVVAINGLRLAGIFGINLMFVYYLAEAGGKKLVTAAFIVGLIATVSFSYMTLPITKDDFEIEEDLKDLLGKKEFDSLMSSVQGLKDYRDRIEELETNNTERYTAVEHNYRNCSYGDGNPIEDRKRLDAVSRDVNETIADLQNSTIMTDEEANDLNLSYELRDDITGIINNSREIAIKNVAVKLLERGDENTEERNRYNLLNALPSLLFGIVYFQTYKKVKGHFETLEEKIRKDRMKELEGEDEDETDEEDPAGDDEDDEDEVFVEGYMDEPEEKQKPKEPVAKMREGKGKKIPKKEIKIMDIDEIRKKYSK